MTNLNICTWNATGLMSSAYYISNLLDSENIDIFGISEHWLYSHDLHFLNSLHQDYNGFGCSDKSLSASSKRRVGKGGVALMWHRKFNSMISPMTIDCDRIIGIQLQLSENSTLYIIQVYLPCSNHSIQTYREHINILNDIISACSIRGRVVVIGDYNAHLQSVYLQKPDNMRSREIRNFMEKNNLIAVNTTNLCEGSRSSFVSYNGGHESLIDHVIMPIESFDMVRRCRILDDNCLNVSSHRPIVVSFCITDMAFACNTSQFKPIKWGKIKQEVLNKYAQELSTALVDKININDNYGCCKSIDYLYQSIVDSIENASNNSLPYRDYRPYLKPYWDQTLKELHRVMRTKRVAWIKDGKPRGHQFKSYSEYKQSKCTFRSYHRLRVKAFMREQNDEIDRAAGIDSGLFWRLFNARKNDKILKEGGEINFDGTIHRNPREITNAWGSHFQSLYSDSEHQSYDNSFYDHVTTVVNELKSTPIEINEDITSLHQLRVFCSKLNCNKMCGMDKVYNEHIMYGGEVLLTYVTMLFNMMYRSLYVPDKMKMGVIVTLYKGGGKRKDDPKSYRAITLSSCLLKLYERCLLESLQNKLHDYIHPLQGGFRKHMGCNMTSFLLRECIAHSNENGSALYACFLDAKQAFDRVWHDGLFYKLLQLGVPLSLLSNVIAMHNNMSSCVLYKGFYSDWFPVLQGTRQGGVWSPFLYLCFINGLIENLVKLNIGFSIANNSLCAPTVADDMLLLSLSRNSLQIMLNECYRYSCMWRYQYNASKCAVVIFDNSKSKAKKYRKDLNLGTSPLAESDNYKHLGVICDRRSMTSPCVKECCDKIRGTFF